MREAPKTVLQRVLLIGLVLMAWGADAADFCAKGGMGAGNGAVATAEAPGAPPGPDPVGGMGGTGLTAALPAGAEAAVVGTITRFGSVCVNGEHVRYLSDTPTEVDGVADTPRALQLGQVVRLQVRRDDDGELVARRIAVVDAVAGPVTERDEAGRWFSVMGRQVFLGPHTMFGNAGPAVPEIGARIIVSGIPRADGRLVTTRVQGADPGSPAVVSGMLTELDGRMLEVEGVAVRLPAGDLPPGLEIGAEVSVRGTWSGDTLEADEILADPLFTVDLAPALVSVEGTLDRCVGPGGHAIGALAVTLPDDAGAAAWIGRRVIGNGRPMAGGGLVLESLRASALDDAVATVPAAAVDRPARVCRPLAVVPAGGH
jgi:hypothetical protein